MAEDVTALEEELDAKYQEILDTLAGEKKLGAFDTLPEADQEQIEDEAETAIEKWMEDNESSPRKPQTRLEQLYADYAAIEAKFPDEEEGEDEQQK
jgi:hypothetical protein